MTCSFCGREFSEAQAEKECRTCSVFGGCKKVKCPYCGYEMPRQPAFFKRFRLRKEKRG